MFLSKFLNKDKAEDKVEKKTEDGTLTALDSDEGVINPRKSVIDMIAPDGINTAPLEYMELKDGAHKVYVSTFYIASLPKSSTFAQTFSALFNMEGVTSSVYIEPESKQKTRKLLNKRILVLDGERATAEKNDINRAREISGKLDEAKRWAKEMEGGVNSLFRVSFLFSLTALSLEDLNTKASAFCALGKENGIELVSTYSLEPEAYLSNAPYAKIFDFNIGPWRKSVIKFHLMDKRSLSNIFNHTHAEFSHPTGVLLGRNMFSGRPKFLDVFNHSHGYAMCIAGMIGSGKSVATKCLLGRMIDIGGKVVSIDYDSPGNVNGEYCQLAYEVGGINFQLRSDTETPINLFELRPTKKYDELRGVEYETLDLKEKIQDVSNIIVTIIKSGKSDVDFDIDTFLREKVTDAVSELYHERGIRDRDVSSLYEFGQSVSNGRLVQGNVRKKLPTISDFVCKILREQAFNKDRTYQVTYALIMAGMKQYVRKLYYCQDTFRRFSVEEYARLEFDNGGTYYMEDNKKHYVKAIEGIKPYFDGETVMEEDIATLPMANFDISQLPEDERVVAQLVLMNFIQENFVKSNAADPSKVENRVFVIDEAHRSFPYKESRMFVSDLYRTCRKKHVSPWTITQSLADYGQWEETKTIAKLSVCKLLFKHDFQDEQYLLDNTVLTKFQTERIMMLGGSAATMEFADEEMKNARKGECCLIDDNRVQFIKVDRLPTEIRFTETDAAMRKRLLAQGR